MKKTLLPTLAALLLNGTALETFAGSDEKWEITTHIEMTGFKMPASTNVVCIPKDGAYTPDKDDKNTSCQVLDLKNNGNKTTWKIRCTGKEEMTGIGAQTRTATTMNGSIKITNDGETVHQTYSGKLVGSCNAAAENAKLDADIKASIKQGCDTTAEVAWKTGGYEPKIPKEFAGKGSCESQKTEVCAKAAPFVSTYKGYSTYKKSNGWVSGACGINMDAQRSKLCAKAVGDQNYNFIGLNCPTEAKTLNDRNCKGFGRDYTADVENPNAAMCKALRSPSASHDSDDASAAGSAGGNQRQGKDSKDKTGHQDAVADTPSMPENTATKAIDAAKKLKGVFGF